MQIDRSVKKTPKNFTGKKGAKPRKKKGAAKAENQGKTPREGRWIWSSLELMTSGLIREMERNMALYDEALDKLYDEAQQVADEYWSHILPGGKEKPKDEGNSLGVRVKRTETGVSITWFYQKWYRSKEGGWKPLSQYIRKGSGPRYAEGRLLAHSAEWARELVLETEEKMAEVRDAVQLISGMRTKTNAFLKALRKRANRGDWEESGDDE